MPVFAPIGTEVDAPLAANTGGWTADKGQHPRISRTDGDFHDHHCIEYPALLRPGASTVGTDKETKVCAKVDSAQFSSKGYLVQVGFGVGERASGNRRIGIIDKVVEYLPGDENRNDE